MAMRREDEEFEGLTLNLTPLLMPVGSNVTAEFHPLADFAAFGEYEAMAVMDTGEDIAYLADGIANGMAGYLAERPEMSSLMRSVPTPVDVKRIKEWLAVTSQGPYDGAMSAYLRDASHLPGGGATFPGLAMALPPQMLIALVGWVEGKILEALAEVSDESTLTAVGGAWMNLMMLQLCIFVEPYLVEPTGPMNHSGAAEFHPYAEFAGFGAIEGKILKETGPLLEPAAGGVIALAYNYLLTRPESAKYFDTDAHLAQRKKTLKAWWIRSTTQPMDGKFHDYMSKVADAHVPGGGTHPHVVIPADLTIALMGWVQMRVMTALNTISVDASGSYVFGTMGEPADTAKVGRAWMRMLTLQLGILMEPYLSDKMAPA
jgi:hypothetical protein